VNIQKELREAIGRRPLHADKNDFGRVFVLAGSRGMSGACYLTAMSCLRSGAGLVTVGIPKGLMHALGRRFTEAMILPLPETRSGALSARAASPIAEYLKGQNVIALGPGLSLNRETQTLVRHVVLRSKLPMVVDADALNAFRGKTKLLVHVRSNAILTPHAAEFLRLFGGKKPSGDLQRKKRAKEVSRTHGFVVVLKGHHTVVAAPDGACYVNSTGNPGMATGGSGDVLTGVIAAMLGRGVDLFRAACFGVYLHGLAGDLAAREKGETSLIAGDILNALPQAFQKVLGR